MLDTYHTQYIKKLAQVFAKVHAEENTIEENEDHAREVSSIIDDIFNDGYEECHLDNSKHYR